MSKLRLTLSIWGYDRMRALADGSVRPEGIDLNLLELPVEETFFRMARNREFDVAELSHVVVHRVALPRSAAVRRDSGLSFALCSAIRASSFRRRAASASRRTSSASASARPEYQMTAPVWIRGILPDDYGVKPESVRVLDRRRGRARGATRSSSSTCRPASRCARSGPDKTLSRMLAAGEIDALHSPRMPSTFYSQPDKVKRLFENYVEVERDYYRRTKIFPIMHVIAIRREVYEANRWIAMSLYKAFVESQRSPTRSLRETAAHKAMLPWMIADIEEARRDMGDDWWPYGFHANRHVLDTFLRYHHEQGLSQAPARSRRSCSRRRRWRPSRSSQMASADRFLLAAVMGWPIAHSRSPLLHNYWFGRYERGGNLRSAGDKAGRPGRRISRAPSARFCRLQPDDPAKAARHGDRGRARRDGALDRRDKLRDRRAGRNARRHQQRLVRLRP